MRIRAGSRIGGTRSSAASWGCRPWRSKSRVSSTPRRSPGTRPWGSVRSGFPGQTKGAARSGRTAQAHVENGPEKSNLW